MWAAVGVQTGFGRCADNHGHGASQHAAWRCVHRVLLVAPVPHGERPDCRFLWGAAVRVPGRPACVLELAAVIPSAAVQGEALRGQLRRRPAAGNVSTRHASVRRGRLGGRLFAVHGVIAR